MLTRGQAELILYEDKYIFVNDTKKEMFILDHFVGNNYRNKITMTIKLKSLHGFRKSSAQS